jgi:hypothetical protein
VFVSTNTREHVLNSEPSLPYKINVYFNVGVLGKKTRGRSRVENEIFRGTTGAKHKIEHRRVCCAQFWSGFWYFWLWGGFVIMCFLIFVSSWLWGVFCLIEEKRKKREKQRCKNRGLFIDNLVFWFFGSVCCKQ